MKYLFVFLLIPFFSYSQSLNFLRVETYSNDNLSFTVPSNEVYLLKSVTKASTLLDEPTINISKDGNTGEFPIRELKFNGNTGNYLNRFLTPNMYLSPTTNVTAGTGDAIFTFFIYDYPTDFEIITYFDGSLDYTVASGEIFHLVQVLWKLNVSDAQQYRTVQFSNQTLGVSYDSFWGSDYNNPNPTQINQYFNNGWNIKPLNIINNIYVAFIYDESTFANVLNDNTFFSYENKMKPYPNPTNSELVLNPTKEYKIEVFDLTGKKVMETIGGSLDMSKLVNATYIIKVLDKSTMELSSYKVVKN